MAGLCKWDRDLDGHRKLVYTIITKEARPSLEKIHHREPVMLKDRSLSSWINVNEPCGDPLSLLNDNTKLFFAYLSVFIKFEKNSKNKNILKIERKIIGTLCVCIRV